MVDCRPMTTGAGVIGGVPRSQSALPVGIIVSRLGRSQLGFHAQWTRLPIATTSLAVTLHAEQKLLYQWFR